MAQIEVETAGPSRFRVRVIEGSSTSEHQVTLEAALYEQLSGGRVPAEELVRRSFEFLLERESKESILARFDLSVISHYFPEYEGEMKARP